MKKIIVFTLLICLLFLTACGKNTGVNSDPTVLPNETHGETAAATQPTDTVAATAPVELKAEDIYNAFLTKIYERLNKIIGDDTHLDGFDSEEGMVGLAEIAMIERTEMLNKIGYTFFDINNDDIDELLICEIDEMTKESCVGTRILCAYTVTDGDKVLLLEGASRNRYYLLDDFTFYNEGSNGAAQTIFGSYSLPEGAQAVSCVDYYFTDEGENQQILLFHNQTGVFDAASSQTFEGNEDAFWNVQKGYAERIQNIDLLPFSAWAG